ncbi:MAG: endo alpha-1,4 polygalactosaminidase [Anaerolineaceae bacterium]
MRKIQKIIILILLASVCACQSVSVDSIQNTPVPPDSTSDGLDYRNEMRQFVEEISSYAHSLDPDFLIIPQNGQELLAQGEDISTGVDQVYMDSIDGIGREDLFYGFAGDDVATNSAITTIWLNYLNLAKENGLSVLVIDYCSTPEKMDDSYLRNQELGFLSFAADHRELDNIPLYPTRPFAENNAAVRSLDQAHNFLYLINPAQYSSKEGFINAITSTNYDLLVMDLYLREAIFTRDEIEQLRHKANGGTRLVLCYLSIGEAEDYRPYWEQEWDTKPPEWLLEENPNWAGNYRVQFWNKDWKAIITGSSDSYLGKIVNSGFDGVYLDLVDAFWEFEDELAVGN